MNVTVKANPDGVTIVLDADAARALDDYIDSIDVADIFQNPGYHGYSADQANAIAQVLSALRQPLTKAVGLI